MQTTNTLTVTARYAHPGSKARHVVASSPITIHQAFTYLVFHYIERPIKRLARRVACSGHWGY